MCEQVVILHETASDGNADGRQEAERRLGFSSVPDRRRGEAKARVLLGRWLGETGQGFGTDVTGEILSRMHTRLDDKLKHSELLPKFHWFI